MGTLNDHKLIIDNDVLVRDLEHVDLAKLKPGVMIYVSTDVLTDMIYLTTIIPGHHHGDRLMHGISVMGPVDIPRHHGPKPVEVTRHLRIGEEIVVCKKPYGRVTALSVWREMTRAEKRRRDEAQRPRLVVIE